MSEETKSETPTTDKSGWRVWSVNVRAIDVQTITVLAPSPEAARERAQDYIDDGEDDAQDLQQSTPDAGWFELGQDAPDDVTGQATAAIEYEPCPECGEEHGPLRKPGEAGLPDPTTGHA